MIQTIVKNQELIIVGQHFFWRNRIHQRIGLNTYSNAAELEALFLQNQMNGPEDYLGLTKHENPIVRQLVAANLELLDVLAQDEDPEVSTMASGYLQLIHRPAPAFAAYI